MNRRAWTWHGQSEAQRFWGKVEIGQPDECWEWSAGRLDQGYGSFYSHIDKRRVKAHRWVLGETDPQVAVLHSCDNPPCCNPAHLFRGTQILNIADMVAKGRQRAPRGANSPLSRWTAEQVTEMRVLAQQGVSQAEIARRFKGARSNIIRIIKGDQYKDVPMPTEEDLP